MFTVGVPVGGAMNEIEFSSDVTFTRFQKKVAATLKIDVEDLELGWKLSTQAKTVMPKLLDSAKSFSKLIGEVTAWHVGGRKSRANRPFEVHLADLREAASKGKGKASVSKGGKKVSGEAVKCLSSLILSCIIRRGQHQAGSERADQLTTTRTMMKA